MNHIAGIGFLLGLALAVTASAQGATDNPPPAPLGTDDGLRIAPRKAVAPAQDPESDRPAAYEQALPPPAEMDVARPYYREMSPHGRWMMTRRYGYVWQPYAVSSTWRPYTVGQWSYTDDGWYWASSDPWPDAPYHYGRWVYLPARGWAWVPGRVWAPAWVVWRSGPGYIGWAALPPEAIYDPATGITWYVAADRSVYADGWIFVDERYVMQPHVVVYVYPPHRNSVYIRSTTVYRADYNYRRGQVYGGGIPVERMQRATGRRIEPQPRNSRARVNPRHSDQPTVRPRTAPQRPMGRPSAPDRARPRGEPERAAPRSEPRRAPSGGGGGRNGRRR